MKTAKANAYLSYQKSQIESASPLGLVVMMYEGAIKFLKLSRESLIDNDLEAACEQLIRVQNIIRELQKSLDMNIKEISPQLYRLYDYMIKRLVQANIKRKVEPIDEVLWMLKELKEAWVTISRRPDLKAAEKPLVDVTPGEGTLSICG